jgi:glutathione S-transferase
MDRMLALIEPMLRPGPYILGEAFSAADIFLFMLVLWHPARQAVLARHPRLGEHACRLRARPAVARIWRQHYPEDGGHPWSTWTGSSAS